MSQEIQIIDFIKSHGSITQKQAVDFLGCYRLSARVWNIRAMGIDVQKEMVIVPNRHGGTARVARYYIPGGVPECFSA